MKKIIASLFVIIVGLSVLTSCHKEHNDDTTNNDNNIENVQNAPGIEDIHNTPTDQPAY